MKNLILIDAHALIHRCFHALPNLTTPQGEPIGAVYGTAVILLKIIKELKPNYLIACFDLAEPTFRHEKFLEYKAQRPKTPEELSSQFSKVKKLLEVLGIKYLEMPGFEADDLIGSLVEKFKKEELKIIIVTGDLDTLQLVENEKVVVYTMKKGIQETIIYDEKAIKERFHLSPSQLIDFKALKGDPSDNIPGIKGIGEKSAIELLKLFGNLENLYQSIEKKDPSFNSLIKKIKPKILKALQEQKEQAFFSKYLATLRRDIPLDLELKDIEFSGLAKEKVIPLFQEWRFESLLSRLGEKPTLSFPQIQISFNQLKEEEFAEFLKEISEGEEIIIFFEENSLEIFAKGKLMTLSSITHFPQLKEILENPKIFKIGYDLKNLYKYLASFGWQLKGIKGDSKIWQWLLNSEIKEWDLERIWRKIFQTPLPAQPKAISLFLIKNWQEKKLKELELEKLSEKIEMPLIPILAKMEMKGIKIDFSYFQELKAKINQEIKNLEEKIYQLVGWEFNINSPKQLAEVIFEKLKISNRGLKRTPKGLTSTQEIQLLKIKDTHPAISLILQHRELSKIKNTYLETLPKLVDENNRLHTHYNQIGTATGRLSSDNPNLQNIPTQGEWGKALRRGFIAEEKNLFLAFDYSQIELRLAAYLSQDEKMLKIFQENQDVHLLTAAEIFNTDPEKVTPEMRRQAKTLNFGVLYGMGPRTFAETTGLPLKEAQKFIEEYYRDFSGIKIWQEKILKEARETGLIKTLTGRIRWVPDLISPQQKYRHLAERITLNFPIQGLAADLIKKAMIEIDQILEKEKLTEKVFLLLQIHDELIFEVEEDVLEKAEKTIKEIMENVFPLTVPLKVNSSWGKNLAELKD